MRPYVLRADSNQPAAAPTPTSARSGQVLHIKLNGALHAAFNGVQAVFLTWEHINAPSAVAGGQNSWMVPRSSFRN